MNVDTFKKLKLDVEAGRLITRNGTPFVTVVKASDETLYAVKPVDADQFTRLIAMLPELVEFVADLTDAMNSSTAFRARTLVAKIEAL